MSWFSRLFATRARVDLANPRDPVLAEWFGGDPADIGAAITPETSLRVSAVYACVSLIAETLAALPLHVYRTAGSDTAKAYDHPLYGVLHDVTWPGRMTAFEWREMMISHTALRGDSFSKIISDGSGAITALEPLPVGFTSVEKSNTGAVRYVVRRPDSTTPEILLDAEVLRIPFKMLDGLRSVSPIEVHRRTIGVAAASQTYLAKFFQNSAQPKGGIKIPATVSDEAVQKMRAAWERRHQGPENAGRVAVFDGGMEWVDIGMTMEDAQYVELQGMGLSDIARIFLVPPHKIGDLRNATFSNIEHQAIEFVTDTLLRWCRRIESRMNAYLLTPKERAGGLWIGFDLKGLLRGDASARANLYKALFYLGALSPDEIRCAEDMNPLPGGVGNRYFVQGAAVPLDKMDEFLARGGRLPGASSVQDNAAGQDGNPAP